MKRLRLLLSVLFPLACAHAAALREVDMAVVPAGPFMMGSDDGPQDERPRHPVVLAANAIDRLPVTNSAFAEFLHAVGEHNAAGERLFDSGDPDARIRSAGGKWRVDAGYEERPVVEVSWAGARNYCEWRKKRLPTEAEWEKAARGTDARRYPWGNEAPDAKRARYGAGWNEPAPVRVFAPGCSDSREMGPPIPSARSLLWSPNMPTTRWT